MQRHKKIALFAHFDVHDIIDEYVLYYLKSLKKYIDHIIFISTSNLSSSERNKIHAICDRIIIRDNVGYDFLSWKIGLKNIDDLSFYDELILCNDSVYGPIFPLNEVLNAQSGSKADFWGITDCSAVKYHLQSYFIVFRKRVFLSETFNDFIDSIKIENSKDEVIKKYEAELTQKLLSKGYTSETFIPEIKSKKKLLLTRLQQVKNRSFRRLINDIKEKKIFSTRRWDASKINKSHLYWKELILKYRMPFIKVELLRENPATVKVDDYKRFLSKNTSYDSSLIENHLKRLKTACG